MHQKTMLAFRKEWGTCILEATGQYETKTEASKESDKPICSQCSNRNIMKIKRTQVWKFLLPILRPLSVISSAVLRLSGDGIQLAPGLPSGLVDLTFFLLGKLLVGNKFFHNTNLLVVYINIIPCLFFSFIKDL